MKLLTFQNFGRINIFKHFIKKLEQDYDNNVKVKILPEYLIQHRTEQKDFVSSIKKLVEGDDNENSSIKPGEIYALPITTNNHLFASVLVKDFNSNLSLILNDSHGIHGISYESLDPNEQLKELNLNVFDLKVETQFNTPLCQIIAISTVKIISEKIAQALLVQNPGEDLNLDIDGLKNTLGDTFKESNRESESKENKDTLINLLELNNNSELNNKLINILNRDNLEAFRHEVLDLSYRKIIYFLEDKTIDKAFETQKVEQARAFETDKAQRDKAFETDQAQRDKAFEIYVTEWSRVWKIIEQAAKQRDETIEQAAKQRDETIEQAAKQRDETIEQAAKQRDETIEQAAKQRDETIEQAAKQRVERLDQFLLMTEIKDKKNEINENLKFNAADIKELTKKILDTINDQSEIIKKLIEDYIDLNTQELDFQSLLSNVEAFTYEDLLTYEKLLNSVETFTHKDLENICYNSIIQKSLDMIKTPFTFLYNTTTDFINKISHIFYYTEQNDTTERYEKNTESYLDNNTDLPIEAYGDNVMGTTTDSAGDVNQVDFALNN